MVKQLAVIKLRSIWNTLRAQIWVLVISLIAYVYGLFMVVGLGIGLVALMAYDPDLGAKLLIALGAAFTLGWIVVPIIFSSQEGTLDPRKLVPFLAPSRKLAWSLVVVTGVGVAGCFYVLVALAEVVAWGIGGGALSAVAAVVGAVLALGISFTWSRAAGAWAGRHQGGRSGREKASLAGFALLMVVVMPLGFWLPALMERADAKFWLGLLDYVKWTPFGAPWALPQAVSAGDWALVALLLVISAATAGLGWWVWLRQLAPAMAGVPQRISPKAEEALAAHRPLVDPSVDSSGHAFQKAKAGAPRYFSGADFWLKLRVNGPTAAVAERTRIYWFRDPRMAAQLIAVVFLVFMGVIMSTSLKGEIDEFSSGFTFFTPFAAFLLGQVIGTLLQFDSTALWVDISAGVRGRDDRAGRFLGSLGIALAIIVIAVGVNGWAASLSASAIFFLFTATLLLFTCSTAATSIIGSQWVYPVQPPGASPLSSKGTGEFLTSMTVGMAQLGFSLALGLIPLGLLGWGYFSEAPWAMGAAVFALVWSVAVSVAAIVIGGRILDTSQVRLLTKIASWPGHGVAA